MVYQDQLCQELRVPPKPSYSSSLSLSLGAFLLVVRHCMHVTDANQPHPFFVMVTLKGFEATMPHNINQSGPSVKNALWKIRILHQKWRPFIKSLISLVWSSLFFALWALVTIIFQVLHACFLCISEGFSCSYIGMHADSASFLSDPFWFKSFFSKFQINFLFRKCLEMGL